VALAEHGARVAVWDVNAAGAEETAALVRAVHGGTGEARVYVADVTDSAKVYALAEDVARDFGKPCSLLINNAGIVGGKPLLQEPDAKIRLTFNVNALAHFWTVKAFLPAMLEANFGHVVTIASAAGMCGVPNLTDYCASKWAAMGFDEALRQELFALGKTGVKTTCVCPYYINTGMFDGVSTRFPLLLPILDPKHVVAKIVTAIKRGDPLLCMPPLVYATPLLKGLLPVGVNDAIQRLLGINASMDDFIGRDGKKIKH